MTTPNDALDFYPTPDSLAFDMVFSLREVKSGFTTYPKPILEPSAGDGALARQVHALAFNVHHDYKTGEVDQYDKGKARSAELDCIELSSDFRAVLKKDGFRVVHDNFLTFRPTTKYAAIVMNPPFSAGAAHLLKALDIMKDGGKVRCLLNAETLRNPCTNERKELAAKLEELHATVKYIPDAFKNARRAAMVHLYFNIIGVMVFLAGFYGLNAVVHFDFVNETIAAWGIAVVHSAFNIAATLILLPFANVLERLAILTIPDDAQKESFALLDDRLLNTPAVAVARARSATADMAELARVGVMQAMSLTHTWDDTLAQKVRDEESKVDQYEDALGTYLVKLSSRELNHADSQSVNTLLHTISDFERISDHSVNLLESAQEMHTKEINFSTDAREELQVLEDAVQDVLNRTTDAFRKDDLHLASKIEPLETVVDELVRAIKARHVARLQAGSCSIEYGFVLEDLLTNYERVCDHCSNVAVAQIEVAQDSFDTHAYLNDLRSGHASTKESEQFQRRLNRYRERYLFPDENVTETEDKQA